MELRWACSYNESTKAFLSLHPSFLTTCVDCFAFSQHPTKTHQHQTKRKAHTMTSRPAQAILKRALSTSTTRRAAPAVFQQQPQTSFENLSTPVVRRHECKWEEPSDDVVVVSSRQETPIIRTKTLPPWVLLPACIMHFSLLNQQSHICLC
jgi:hypothetical protein